MLFANDQNHQADEEQHDQAQYAIRGAACDAAYRRIEQRVDMMLDAGVCDELRSLMEDGGFMSNATAMQAIGYKELIPYIRGESSLCECADVLKRATRRYAKRQLTWFSGRGYARPLLCDGHGAQRSTAELADEYIRMLGGELSL